MEHSSSIGEGAKESASDGYDLECQLALAERRYAEARSVAHKARDEYRAFEGGSARFEAIKIARARYEAAEAKCKRLKALIDRLEDRLG